MESFSGHFNLTALALLAFQLDTIGIVGSAGGDGCNPSVGHPPCNGSSVPAGSPEETERDVTNVPETQSCKKRQKISVLFCSCDAHFVAILAVSYHSQVFRYYWFYQSFMFSCPGSSIPDLGE